MKKLLKTAAVAAAPKMALAAMNPKKAAALKAGKWAMGRVMRKKRGPSAGEMALKGLGAAAVALPLGLWLGRRFNARQAQ